MPPLPDVPGVLRVVCQGNSGEATPITWANVLHFRYSGTPPSNVVCGDIASNVSSAWATHMSPEQVSNILMNFVSVTDLTSHSSGSAENFASHVGTRGDDEIPANVAFLVSYPQRVRFRGGHPRSYLMVGGNADFLDAAHWSAAFTTEVANHWHDFLAEVLTFSETGTTVTELCAVSYVSREVNPVPPYRRPVPLVLDLSISGMIAQQQIATQRRRIGRNR